MSELTPERLTERELDLAYHEAVRPASSRDMWLPRSWVRLLIEEVRAAREREDKA